MGQDVSLKSIRQMISTHDTKENGVLDYDEFVEIFFDLEKIPWLIANRKLKKLT